MRKFSLVLGFFLLACWSPSPAHAQAPAGPEFRLAPLSSAPGVAGTGSGFVVVWHQYTNPFTVLMARRHDAAGTPLGNAFRVSTYNGEIEQSTGRPIVDAAPDGRFVVVWESRRISGSGTDVFARRFDAGGNALGAEFRVNSATPEAQEYPSVAMADDGSFVVAWDSPQFSSGVIVRHFNAAGAPTAPEYRLDTYTTTTSNLWVSVFDAPGGAFLVTWMNSQGDGHAFGSFARRIDAAGQPVGAQFQLNATTANSQEFPQVAFDPSGSFLAVWDGFGPADATGVFGQRFDAAGNRLGAEFRVNATSFNLQARASVAAEAGGRYFVTWLSQAQDGSEWGVFGRLFDGQGRPIQEEFQVNTYTTGYQVAENVASDGNGRLLVVWQSTGQDAGLTGAYAQALGGLRPTAVAVDAAGNGVAEPAESVTIAPTWLNTTGAGVGALGTATAFQGPAAGIYAINDGAATYGTLASGGSASCGADCYAVTASASTRPSTHWDARLTETLTTGHHFPWRLHLGDSFADVPRTSLFYRFIETLLHRNVTGGCSTTTYCPEVPTNREQLAVFVLAAREGADYAPFPCVTPVFADVPAASPFCRYIEELARRGVVNGCGGGNYCPLDPVTREQMAVFVLRTLDPALSPPACTTPVFADVPAGSPFCRWIEELARRGIVTGCGGGNYCPQGPVTREQMAVFLTATFGLTLYVP